MGRSAKGYKKPTLKEKQQSRKAKSSSHDGAIVKDWSTPSSTVRLAAAAMKQSAGSSSKSKGKLAADEDEEADDIQDEEEEDDNVESASKSAEATSSEASGNQTKKKRDLRSRSKGATGSGGTDGEEARTPREQGIDYLQLWQGRKTEIASARIKQGRPVQK
ncbi:hypothetical protein CF326_g2758 [Tilletia indica]|nr:hypothetical protein CF326_g2758 [Tilletia indica]